MKKFRFRLEKLLQIKSHNKMEKQKELSQAERVRRMEEAHLAMLEEKLKQEIDDLGVEKKEKINLDRRARSVHYQKRLESNMATQKRVISDAKKKEEAKRQNLIEASKEEKTYEKLKERQQERHLKEGERLLQKETDEIAKNTHLRKKPKDN